MERKYKAQQFATANQHLARKLQAKQNTGNEKQQNLKKINFKF